MQAGSVISMAEMSRRLLFSTAYYLSIEHPLSLSSSLIRVLGSAFYPLIRSSVRSPSVHPYPRFTLTSSEISVYSNEIRLHRARQLVRINEKNNQKEDNYQVRSRYRLPGYPCYQPQYSYEPVRVYEGWLFHSTLTRASRTKRAGAPP